MPFYTDSATLLRVLTRLFEDLSNTPGATEEFGRTKMLIHVQLTEPEVFIALNARNKPVRFDLNPDGKIADLSLQLEADLLHQIWLGKVRLRDAFFGGKIKTQGSIFKAMQLAPLFRQAEAHYPRVLKEQNLLSF